MSNAYNSTSFNGTCSRYRRSCEPYSPLLLGSLALNIPLGAVLAVASVLGNGMVFAAYYYSESLRRPAHILLLSLAATDLLSGLVAQPLFIVEKSLLLQGCYQAICTLEEAVKLVMLCLIGATILNLSMLTLDRYIAVCHTFQYPELVTNSRVIKSVILLWLFWVVFSFSWMKAFSGVALTLFVIVLAVNIVFISFLYFKIYREIRSVESNQQNVGSTSEEEEKATRKKSVRTLGYIFGLLFFCFVPMIIHGILSRSKILHGFHEREPFLVCASNAAFSNSFLNVLVYYWRNEEVREAMRKVLRKLRQKFQNEVNP